MICSSVRIVRFIVHPFLGAGSSRYWRKNPVAGQNVGHLLNAYILFPLFAPRSRRQPTEEVLLLTLSPSSDNTICM